MRSAWASGLHLRSRTDEKRGAGYEVNTFKQSALIHDGYERTWHATPGLCGTQTKGVMEAFLVSAGVVALAEIGDKTQLLAILLATRFRKPVPILCGILLATAANHALAALAGQWVGETLAGPWLRWVLGLVFLAMAAWVLVPDRLEAESVTHLRSGNAFLVTLCSFFIVEIGDKTQIATAALAARFDSLGLVVLGTTVGLMIADLPAVLCGHLIGHRLDPRWPRAIAALIFTAHGLLVLSGVELDLF
jgi:Ca2+/H+ antiporter, TMEM165/GDT1 family